MKPKKLLWTPQNTNISKNAFYIIFGSAGKYTHIFKLLLKGLGKIIFMSLWKSKYLINVIFNLILIFWSSKCVNYFVMTKIGIDIVYT